MSAIISNLQIPVGKPVTPPTPKAPTAKPSGKPASKPAFPSLGNFGNLGDLTQMIGPGMEALRFANQSKQTGKQISKALVQGNLTSIPGMMMDVAKSYQALSPQAQQLIQRQLQVQINNARRDPAGTILPVVQEINRNLINDAVQEAFPDSPWQRAGARFALQSANRIVMTQLTQWLSTGATPEPAPK